MNKLIDVVKELVNTNVKLYEYSHEMSDVFTDTKTGLPFPKSEKIYKIMKDFDGVVKMLLAETEYRYLFENRDIYTSDEFNDFLCGDITFEELIEIYPPKENK